MSLGSTDDISARHRAHVIASRIFESIWGEGDQLVVSSSHTARS
jgi:hypothetical protein